MILGWVKDGLRVRVFMADGRTVICSWRHLAALCTEK